MEHEQLPQSRILDAALREEIQDAFDEPADFSLMQDVVYFDYWSSYEESGGLLIFTGIDGSLQRCDFGYCVMATDHTCRFEPVDISADDALAAIQEMKDTIASNSETMHQVWEVAKAAQPSTSRRRKSSR